MAKKDDNKQPGIIRALINASMSVYEKFSKMLDVLLYNRTGALVVSLLAAIIITAGVNYQDIRTRLFNDSLTSVDVSDVHVDALYDHEKYDVKGVPSQVDVVLTGNAAQIQAYRTQGNIRVVADLRQQGAGDNTIDLEITNLPENIQATITPKTITATLLERITKEFTITPELMLDSDQKAGDYETPILSESTVQVTGSQNKIDSIRAIKAVVDVSGQTSSFEAEATLVAYDATGNTVDVDMQPATVKVNVKMKGNNE